MRGAEVVEIPQACDLLRQAEVKSCGLLSNGSNYVFLLTIAGERAEFKAIYKPRQGEAPLWDFPEGTLYKREFAAFVVSQALQWHLVPPTVIRSGPYGVGSVQWFIDAENTPGHCAQNADPCQLKRAALFDYLTNNADRKAGHFLQDKEGRLWLIDHGLTFNAAPKLRTVLWDFAGQSVPDELMASVRELQDKLKLEKHLRRSLSRLVREPELAALADRVRSILETPVFPRPGPYRNVPWPWF